MTRSIYTQELCRWFAKHGIIFHPFVELRRSKYGGIGVFATTNLDPEEMKYGELVDNEGELEDSEVELKESSEKNIIYHNQPLARIPKTAIFSARSSRISKYLKQNDIEGPLALLLAFIYEFEYIEQSKWCEYFQSFDMTSVDVPPSLWSSSEKNWIVNSEVGDVINNESLINTLNICVDFAEVIQAEHAIPIPQVLQINSEEDTVRKVQDISRYSLILSSRAFNIDQFHEYGLVPGADLFNHSSLGNNCHFESSFEVCTVCGRSGCLHVGDETEEDLMGEEDEDDEEEDDDEEEQYLNSNIPEYLKNHRDEKRKVLTIECCDVILHSKVSTNEELLFDYGCYNNPMLLHKYNFTELFNSHDYVQLKDELSKLVEQNNEFDTRITWWHNIGCSKFLRTSEQKFEDEDFNWIDDLKIGFNGVISNTLLAVSRLLTMDHEIFRKVHDDEIADMSVFEDLDGDCYELLKHLISMKIETLIRDDLYNVAGADENYILQLMEDPRIGKLERRRLNASVIVNGEVMALNCALEKLRF